MRAHLAAREVPEEAAEEVIAELEEGGYLDDAAYARRLADDRRRLDGWGADRIAGRLTELGVDRAHVAAALAAHSADDERDAAAALLRRRFPHPLRDDRERTRALGVLVRRGYDSELAHDVVRAHAAGAADAA